MRVLHLYSGNLYGGIERVLATLARNRADCPRMEPAFGLCFEGRLSRELCDAATPAHLLGAARVSRPWTLWRARARLAELLAHERFDAAITHSYWPHAIFAPVVAHAGVPLVMALHDVPTGDHWLEKWARRVCPDLVLANSHHTAAAAPLLFPQARCEVCYWPVPRTTDINRAAARQQLRSDLGATDDTVAIVMCCRLERYKGHALLLAALSKLQDAGNWVCWIAGGPQRPHERQYLAELRMLAEHLRIGGRVWSLGQREDVPALLAAADIHCQPNIRPEPFGVAFVEALQAGLPVVTTAMGGGAEIINDDCGILVSPNDAQALAAALRRLIVDRQLRADLGACGPRRAAELCEPTGALARLHGTLASLRLQQVAMA